MGKLTYSIVICVYNPDRRLLCRLLNAVSRLKGLQDVDRIVIVDNNSSPKLEEYPEVKRFLASAPRSSCIIEEIQGLSHARLRGIRETRSDIVIFFDDDNEPCSDYLELVCNAFVSYPNSGVWGPAIISVEYVDDAPEEVKRNSTIFQERNLPFGYVCIPGKWSNFCPFGTGLAANRQVLASYVKACERGRLSRSGRKGTSLASGDDVQIVWEAFSLGLSAGVLPDVSCNHMINSFKANRKYCLRLKFWTASSYLPALVESFPSVINVLGGNKDTWPRVQASILSKYYQLRVKDLVAPRFAFERNLLYAGWLGSIHGNLVARESQHAMNLLRLAERLGFA